MKASRFNLTAIPVLLLAPAVMRAQGGCTNSPEAPTNLLMLVGTIGMVYGSSVVMKFLRKNKK